MITDNSSTNQPASQALPPDDSRAALGIGTQLLQHNIPQAAPEPAKTPEKPAKQPSQEDDKSELNGIKQQIIALKQEIEKALTEDKKEDQNEDEHGQA